MQFQQTLPDYSLGIVVIVTPRLWYRVLITIAPKLRDAIRTVEAGHVIQITV